MPHRSALDTAKLLLPITDENPQGSDIREDRSPTSDYYTIKDARNAARAAERSALADDSSENDVNGLWREVITLSERLLSSKTKDLEVAVWCLEGLVRIHGVYGLRDGLQLINGLVSSHWDGLHPLPDEDGMETRVAPLTGLNGDGGEGTLLAPLRNLPMVDDSNHGGLSFWQYLQARDADRIEDEDKKAERIAHLGYDLAVFEQAVACASVEDSLAFLNAFEESQSTYALLTSNLREKCGQDAPPSSKISELLAEITRTVRFVYKEKIEQEQAAKQQIAESNQSSAPQDESEVANNVVAIVRSSGAITNREDALKRLEEVAKYFRQHEPHTPLAPSLERLVQWGRMTVAELMMELIPDSSARSLFSQYTGVKLDGSDSHVYVAPPTARVSSAAEPTNHSSTASPVAPEKPAASKW